MEETQTPSQLTGHALALVTTIIWGTTFISTKVLLTSFSPTEILLVRFVLGYFSLKLIYPHMLRLGSLKEEALYALCGLTGVTLYYLFENSALKYTLASTVGILVSTAPLLTALFAFLLSRGQARLQWTFLAGLGLAFFGIIIINLNGARLHLDPKGSILALGAALAWAVYSLLLNKVNSLGHPALQSTQRIFFWGVLFIIPIALREGINIDPSQFLRPVNLVNLLYLSFLACSLCYVFWNHASGILGAVKINIYIYLDPVIAMAASALILHEPVTRLSLLGTCLILTGLVVSNLSPAPSAERSR
jgi:drug/metabolite transporter (DMT)-like permease